jgi:two-component system KDP operon response regulator KdpE
MVYFQSPEHLSEWKPSNLEGGTAMGRLVIVDDEVKLANVLKGFLELRGFQVWAATTGEEGLQLIQVHRPNVLLLDWNLGTSRVSGEAVLKQTKMHFPTISVIIISASMEHAKALHLGAACYLDKPLSMANLLKALHDAMAV